MTIKKKNIILFIYLILSIITILSNNCIDNCRKYYLKSETNIDLTEQCILACKNGHLTHYLKNC